MKIFTSIVFFILTAAFAKAQSAGELDTTFHSGWFANGNINCAVLQPDGKIIVAGAFTTFNHTHANKIVRLYPDLTVDESFEMDVLPDGDIMAVNVTADGKIIIGGNFIYLGEYESHHIARLNSNGTLDFSFNVGTAIGPLIGFDSYITKVENIDITADNKIVIAGYFNQFDGYARNSIARLNSDGSLDFTFNPATILTTISAVKILPDNKILVGSQTLRRLNEDGTIDTSFNTSTNTNYIKDIAITIDNKILVGGDFTTINGISRNQLARMNEDGVLDGTFIPDPISTSVQKIGILPDGKILIGGTPRLEKFNSDGTIDVTFTQGVSDQQIYGLLLADAKCYPFGSFSVYSGTARNSITCVTFDGINEVTVSPQQGGVGTTSTSTIQSIEVKENDIYLAGIFTTYNGTTRNNLVKLNKFGIRDLSFSPIASGILSSTGKLYDLCLVEEGKLLIGGSGSGISELVVKLNSDGSKDAAFNDGTGFTTTDVVRSLAIQPDGKYVISGLLTTYNGISRPELIRVSNIGTFDANYSICCSAYNVYTTDIQHDGKILLAGDFGPTGSSSKYFNRLITEFTSDPDFIPVGLTGANGTVREIIDNPADSSILIVGDFTTINTTNRNRICKLNNDGSVDLTFDVGVGPDGSVYAIEALPNGRFLVGGTFTHFNGIEMPYLVCLMPDGTLDNDFNAGFGPNGPVYDIKVFDNYSAIIGGAFTSYNTSTRDNVARIYFADPMCFDMVVDINDVICDGYTYTLIDGSVVNTPGSYTASGTSEFYCDSTVNYHITLSPVYNVYLSAVINEGESYTLPNGTVVTTSGTYPVTLATTTGCDSVVNTILIVLESCSPPGGVGASLITTNSAKISWTTEPAATKYQIQYRPLGAGVWQKKNVTGVSKTLTGLTANTTYQYKVKSICGAENSDFSAIQTFTTLPLKSGEENHIQCIIYPNPNNGNFEIEIAAAEFEKNELNIFNIQGQIIYNSELNNGVNSIKLIIPVGLYYVQISNPNQIIVKQLVITN